MTSWSFALNDFNEMFSRFVETNYDDDRSSLHAAVRYCLNGRGKRVRASLAMMVCQSYQQPYQRAFSSATAVEMIHAYSLAHDDLPCMDNDDIRRGRPSLHRAFDEATALLAGDALLTDAFNVIMDEVFFQSAHNLSAEDRLRQVGELAKAAGGRGMVLGQSMDMTWTGRMGFDKGVLDAIHAGKTGALLGAACAMGAIAAGADTQDVARWRECGILTGLAFQAVDDTLDLREGTGKSSGKDDAQGKLTYLTLFDRKKVLELAEDYTEKATALIPNSCEKQSIVAYLQALIHRKN
jgi:geranylgeranyl diphosphate synthase type II